MGEQDGAPSNSNNSGNAKSSSRGGKGGRGSSRGRGGRGRGKGGGRRGGRGGGRGEGERSSGDGNWRNKNEGDSAKGDAPKNEGRSPKKGGKNDGRRRRGGRGGRGGSRGRGGRGHEARPQDEDETAEPMDADLPLSGFADVEPNTNSSQAMNPFAPPASENEVNEHHSSVLSGGGGVVASHPPIFMTRLNTHLSLDGFNGGGGEEEGEGEGDHIAEQLAAGLLIDDGEDDVGLSISQHSSAARGSFVEEEKDTAAAPQGKKQFVTLPVGFAVGEGGNVLTADEARRERKLSKEMGEDGGGIEEEKKEHVEVEEPAEDVGEEADVGAPAEGEKKKAKRKKKKKKSKAALAREAAEEEAAAEAAAPVSVTEQITKIKATEVSIGASTKVAVKRTDSQVSLSSLPKATGGDDNAPVYDLLGAKGKKVTGAEKTDKGDHKKGRKGKKSKGAPGDDAAAKLRAARQFNRSVRQCVERCDPDGMREILRDKSNHHFALDGHVLETVMKAYVMAAMFEDALYCLRNCSLPDTLAAAQTERILLCIPQNLRNSSAYTAADMIDALCIATKFDEPTARTYFMRIVRGIALEFLEEATSARDRICSAPCERLVRSSHCVVDARLRRGKKATDLVVDPGHQLGVFMPDTQENRGMQSGDAVSILPYAGPYPMSAESLDRNMIEATVTNAAPLVLRLQDRGNTNLFQMLIENVEGNVYRIDKLANRMGFNRQLAAAVAVAAPFDNETKGAPNRNRPCAELVKAVTAMDENIDKVLTAGGNFNGGALTSTAALCTEAVPWSFREQCEGGPYDQDAFREESNLALEKYGTLEGLNDSQRLAVQGAVSNRLTLVQGPPGTGKTAVAIRILKHWARLAMSQAKYGENPPPILATSDSNIAVDNLVEGCANVGLRVVRLGRPEAIRPELLPYCIDRPTDKGSFGDRGGFQSAGSFFKERMKTLKNAQVVCCTCIGSGGDILDSSMFERVLVDEATQATEPAVLVPLTRGCRQLVLVGDHCQLPPTVLSTRAEEEGLGVPLFSRMVACGVPPFMLDTQYRMHPGISMFPSDLFYGGKLMNGVTPPERRPLQGFPWPREEFPIAFIPVVDGFESDDGISKANEAEAHEVCNSVMGLLNGGQCTVSDIAVVTPYAAQVRLIRRQLKTLLPRGPPFVEVSSTDGFQGREKEAVIFSAVRSNTRGAVGFVSDWRRINVSFTRARRALIVIGNPDTLRRGDPDTFGAWIQWADAHGVNMMSPGKPRGRYDAEVLRKVRGGTTAAEMLKDVLSRQQAQVKTAEQKQAKAVRNAAGHIMGEEKEEVDPQALKDDLAELENADGCWDDSDDDDAGMVHNTSRVSMTTSNETDEEETSGDPLDAWDL
ncbi:hypothetical protein ACHAXT_007660 [Thalassiosira profunda]